VLVQQGDDGLDDLLTPPIRRQRGGPPSSRHDP
jgi:hypothetical protein